MILLIPHFQNNHNTSLPHAWLGDWTGKVQIEKPGTPPRQLGMRLSIAKLQNRAGTTWKISYLDGKKVDVRNYVLLDQPESANAFVTDENNGIVLDDVLVGDTLYSLFVVQSSEIHVRFRITRKSLEVEMCSYDYANPRSSLATQSGEKVQSYKLKSVQIGVLHRS